MISQIIKNKIFYKIYQSSKRYTVCFLCMHSMGMIFRRKMVESVGECVDFWMEECADKLADILF